MGPGNSALPTSWGGRQDGYSGMSRHRFCMTSDRDGFIEELAEEMWEERQQTVEQLSWSNVEPEVRSRFRKLAAETLRILEHGHG